MKFKKNEGIIDRIIRVVAGLVLIALGMQYAAWLWFVGLVVLGTGLVGWCGLYHVLGISTCKVKSTEVKDQTPPSTPPTEPPTSTPPVM